MNPPFVLYDQGDLALFESAEDLERYVESPDIGHYRVFDANGNVVYLAATQPLSGIKGGVSIVPVVPVRINADISGKDATNDLEEILRAFLHQVTGKLYDQSSLPELFATLQATIGFTR